MDRNINNIKELEKDILAALKAVDELRKSIPVGTVSCPSKLDDKYHEKLSWLGIDRKKLKTPDGDTFPVYRIFATNTQVLIVRPNEAIRYEGDGHWEPMER